MKHPAARKHLHVLRAWECLPVAIPTIYRPPLVATRANREIAAGEQARGDQEAMQP